MRKGFYTMGIFSRIKDAIFGGPAKAQEAPADVAVEAAPIESVEIAAVDVEGNLNSIAAAKGTDLNWRTSIVDLMKLLDIDSSLDNRKSLAQELGYTGALDGSAEMNIWLHKAVMRELAANGGKVPAELTD